MTRILRINMYARNKPGFLDLDRFHSQFKAFLPGDSFESLRKPLFITATNLLDGTLRVFNNGELIRPILASIAVPGIFAPVQIGDGYYIDGGTLNNFPVDLIRPYCDQVIGVYANPFGEVQIQDLKHAYNVMERAYHIMIANETFTKFKYCDILIKPKGMGNFGLFSFNSTDALLDLGYKAALEAISSYNGPQICHLDHS